MNSKELLHSQPVSMSDDSESDIFPCMEYLLQGSVMDSEITSFLHLLKGLCDNAGDPVERFHDLEMCYSLHGELPLFDAVPRALYLRVRRALDHPPDFPWQLRYIGEPEVGTGDKARPTIVRSSLNVAVTHSIVDYLELLGAKLEFEYTADGYLFKKGLMKIMVSKIKSRVPSRGWKPIEKFISQSYLVELSVLAPSSQEQKIGEEMKAFAEKLKPLVHVDKTDYKRLPPLS